MSTELIGSFRLVNLKVIRFVYASVALSQYLFFFFLHEIDTRLGCHAFENLATSLYRIFLEYHLLQYLYLYVNQGFLVHVSEIVCKSSG